MKTLALAATLTAALTLSVLAADSSPARPSGPCDIYGAAGTPCVAAHSTTRALYASYNGALYQIKRQSDGRTLDIGVVQPVKSKPEAGGYANAAAHDAFCANTLCVINLIYDQSGKGNHLYQAPAGPSFPGPEKGGFDTQPIADMAPITVGGHKAYGVFIMPGMGFRNNSTAGIAINDEPEGIYYVIDGTHYDSGCCFDYGNSSTNGRAVGTGTMETTYFGTSTGWGSGNGPGPWIMSDMEAGLFSGYNAKQNTADPTIDSARFVTAVVDGGGGNKWDLRGGNAQKGGLTTFYTGVRPGSQTNSSYYPMRKQGGILLGTGGDNGNGSSGTFYEGVMTAGYPSEATTDAVQANVVAARYDGQMLNLSRLTTFTPSSSQSVTVTFTNTTGAPARDVKLSISAPAGWTALKPQLFPDPIGPGASVSAKFNIQSPPATGAGFLTARSEWKSAGADVAQSDTAVERIRNVPPIKINEVRFSAGANPADQFIELYNSSPEVVDLSRWSLIGTQSQWAPVVLATIPAGTKLAGHAYYLLGISASGLAAPASPGVSVIQVRSIDGLEKGRPIDIDGETRMISSVGTAASPMTTVFVPVSTTPRLGIPAGSNNLPVTNAAGFETGQKMGIDIGGSYELATVTKVGKAATQTTLAVAAVAGATNIKVAADANVMAGDSLTVGTGEHKEIVKVGSVGSAGATGAGIDLAAPLRFAHAMGIDVSDVGTGISFVPATKYPHMSGDAVQALGSGVTLDRPLSKVHQYGAPVTDTADKMAGYQGAPAPNQWFGGVLSGRGGSIALLDRGAVADAIVYGSKQSNSSANGTIASPELATLEGDQGQGGCMAVLPGTPPRGAGPVAADGSNRSLGRFPDGADADSNCTDFLTQAATTLQMDSAAGAMNVKVASVNGFVVGQTIMIDAGSHQETAAIATVGTAGATSLRMAVDPGATVIPLTSALGFSAGQTVTIDGGAARETAVIASVSGGRGGVSVTVSAPVTQGHAAGVQISGSGITFTAGLTRAHASGTPIANNVPTPGGPNKY